MKSFVWELKWWQGFIQLSFNLEIKAQLFSVTHVDSLTFAFASFSILFSHNHPLFQTFSLRLDYLSFPLQGCCLLPEKECPFLPFNPFFIDLPWWGTGPVTPRGASPQPKMAKIRLASCQSKRNPLSLPNFNYLCVLVQQVNVDMQ